MTPMDEYSNCFLRVDSILELTLTYVPIPIIEVTRQTKIPEAEAFNG